MDNKIKVSIVIPVYNQYESLMKVLYGFTNQEYPSDLVEIIVIDDGSTDDLADFDAEGYSDKWKIHLTLVHQNNKGRACARNLGIHNATGDIVIFCDGDRVPDSRFISEHVKMHEGNGAMAVVGVAYDYFGGSSNIMDKAIDWVKVTKLSRLSAYYKKISMMYDESGRSVSEIVWMSFLVGNSSVSREAIAHEKFDECFTEWGFEHFELAYRLFKNHVMFRYNTNARNYHIPHKREIGFYENQIKKSAKLLASIHPEINDSVLVDFVYSNMSIGQAEKLLIIKKEEEKRNG